MVPSLRNTNKLQKRGVNLGRLPQNVILFTPSKHYGVREQYTNPARSEMMGYSRACQADTEHKWGVLVHIYNASTQKGEHKDHKFTAILGKPEI